MTDYSTKDENEREECEHKTGKDLTKSVAGCVVWICEWGCGQVFISTEDKNDITKDVPLEKFLEQLEEKLGLANFVLHAANREAS